MKIPKLKYYYFAMSPEEYSDFETNRTILVDVSAVIDTATGQIRNRQRLMLLATAAEADTQFRLATESLGSVYVLRIPRESVDRSRLDPVGTMAWYYDRSITVSHCGVDRFDLDSSAAPIYNTASITIDTPVQFPSAVL